MKVYLDKKGEIWYRLTNKEFKVALKNWDNNILYWCERMGVLIPKSSIFIAEKDDDDRYYHAGTKVLYKKRNNGFYNLFSDDNEKAIPLDKQNPDEFLTEDEYFDNNKLLTK